MIDASLIQILACPACKSAVSEQASWIVCGNAQCSLRFPIRDGIPVMLIDEAENLSKSKSD